MPRHARCNDWIRRAAPTSRLERIEAYFGGHGYDMHRHDTYAVGRTLAGQNAIRAVEKAMEIAGGAGCYRDAGLERLFRDVQGARFHPLQEKQQRLTGRLALGLDIDG